MMYSKSANSFARNEKQCDFDKNEVMCVNSQSLKSITRFRTSLSNNKMDEKSGMQAPLISNASAEPHLTNSKSVSKQSLTGKFCYINEKKTCNCTKSHCLKLYCECFARGQSCIACSCSNCMNNLNFEEDRTRAIQQTLDKNPSAFHPKIGCVPKKHFKGCNCKRSSCLKNYCECFEAKLLCSDLCKCKGCRNYSDSSRSKSLEILYFSQNSKRTISDFAAFISPGLIEVVCSCMLSQLILSESGIDQETIILVEFAKFLEHVLKSINILLKNDQNNFFPCVESPSLAVPHFTSSNISDGNVNDMTAGMLEEGCNLPGRSNEYSSTDPIESNGQQFPDFDYCNSSNIPGLSISSHYDQIQPSFRSLLSTSEGADTFIPHGYCESLHNDSATSPSGYPVNSPRHSITAQFSDSTIQDNTITEPPTYEHTLIEMASLDDDYSSEADLAAAAISGEITNSPNLSCNNIYDLNSYEPDYYSNYLPLSNPFGSILYY